MKAVRLPFTFALWLALWLALTTAVSRPPTTQASDHNGASWVSLSSQMPPVQQAKLTADDGAGGDQFGQSVAIDGEIAIVGSYLDNTRRGAAYVFTLQDGEWTQQDKLVPNDNVSTDEFGYAVALEGDTAVVSARLDNIGATTDAGSAYVFRLVEGVWVEESKLTADDLGTDDQFGDAVAISGDTIIVGASQQEDSGGTNTGAAYVFVREMAGEDVTWIQQAKLTSLDRANNDRFGFTVDIDGNTAIVGSPLDDDGADGSGAAYVFVRSGTVWSQQAKLTSDAPSFEQRFGYAVGISGETAVVGATQYDDGTTFDAGAAYIFLRSGIAWNQEDLLMASDRASFDLFGNAVAIEGDTVLIGANYGDVDGQADAGAAYVFARTGADWNETGKLTADDRDTNDWLAWSIGLSGETAVLGAPRNDDTGQESGSAYIFAIASRMLTVSKAGTGTGHITSLPAGIDCGAVCTADFVPGTVVTLTATPTNGSTFAGWGGAISGTTNPITVTMDIAQAVTATFDGNTVTHLLTVGKAGTGTGQVTSNPAGIDCGATCSANFGEGGIVVLTATAANGSVFTGWTGDITSSANPLNVGIDGPKNMTATFILQASLNEKVFLPLITR